MIIPVARIDSVLGEKGFGSMTDESGRLGFNSGRREAFRAAPVGARQEPRPLPSLQLIQLAFSGNNRASRMGFRQGVCGSPISLTRGSSNALQSHTIGDRVSHKRSCGWNGKIVLWFEKAEKRLPRTYTTGRDVPGNNISLLRTRVFLRDPWGRPTACDVALSFSAHDSLDGVPGSRQP